MPRTLAFYFLLNIMFICNFSVCSMAVISMRGYRQKGDLNRTLVSEEAAAEKVQDHFQWEPWPGLEKKGGDGSSGVPGQGQGCPHCENTSTATRRAEHQAAHAWPTAKCKVKCGSNETCRIHHLKKKTEK